jgi:hypothetical protein
VIKKGDSKATIERKLKKFTKREKGFPAFKFLGKVKFEGDPVEIQRKMRNEWEERSGRH